MKTLPDKWVVIKITEPSGKFIYKVLAGWFESYLYGQSWQLNSGITQAIDKGNYYDFHGFSGSVYRCHKDYQGLTTMTAGILKSLQNQAEKEGYNIEFVEDTDYTRLNYDY